MSTGAPIAMLWDGEVLRPATPAWARRADKEFVIGEQYFIGQQEPRSINSHNHFFASVHAAWENLPEEEAARFPSADHLRRYALISTGFADSHTLICDTPEDAQKAANFIQPIDEFSLVIVRGNVVERFSAKSQSMRAMGKEEFQRSKEAVLAFLSQMIGVTPAELQRGAA